MSIGMSAAPRPHVDSPLYVDMDGTLLLTDTLHQCITVLVRHRPWLALLLPLWLCRGKAYLKARTAAVLEKHALLPDPAFLPWRADLLEYLRRQRSLGRSLILATGANERLARAVADHLGIFDDVLASTDKISLTGRNKLQAILNRQQQLRLQMFAYAGNSSSDFVIWEQSSELVVTGISRDKLGHRTVGKPVIEFS